MSRNRACECCSYAQLLLVKILANVFGNPPQIAQRDLAGLVVVKQAEGALDLLVWVSF